MEHLSRQEELFRKYLANQCSEEELKELFRYLSDQDFHPAAENSLKNLWDKVEHHTGLSESASEKLFARAMRTTASDIEKGKIKNNFRLLLLIAATFTGILILTGVVYFFLLSQEMTQINTTYGETQKIILPDSSVVTLNANSSIQYRDWDKKEREVWLTGEAFFDITKNPLQGGPKFIVHTEGLDVEVLGTRFNVRNRHNATEVVLNSGKLRLNFDGDQEIFMEPGDMVAYSLTNNLLDRKKVNPETYTSWRNKILVFEESRLDEIGAVLHDNYGYVLTFQDPEIAKFRFTTKLSANEIDLLFPMLEESFNLKIIQNDKHITMEKAP